MDPNLWLDGAGSSAMMDYTPDFWTRVSDEELTTTLPADPFATQQPTINIGCAESYQNDHMLHSEHGVPCFADSSLSSWFNFQLPFMDDPTYYSDNLGFLTQEYSSLPNQQIHIPSSCCFTTAQLPINFGESSQDMLPIEDCIFGLQGYTSDHSLSSNIPISSNPLMDTVQGATFSSLGRTRRETGKSSRRSYMKFSPEDVIQLILAVGQYGRRWKLITQLPYFKDSGRTKEQLMEKWRHMTTRVESADHQKDPDMRDLYIWAKNVNKLVDKKNEWTRGLGGRLLDR